jgi:lipooligosaccharide transport system permease protein
MSSVRPREASGREAPGRAAPRRDVALRILPLRVFPLPLLSRRLRSLGGRGSVHLVERHARAYRHVWMVFLSGIAEPVFYLFSIGVGLGHLVGAVTGPAGRPVTYAAFVAPALLATSSMNGAIFDSTFNVFFRLKYAKLYDAALATPMRAGEVALGEISWALIRGALYALAFTVVMLAMGLLRSPWAALTLPAAVLTGFGFAAVGMAATTFMRSWQDFEYITLASLPLFLFSTTFYPLSIYPRPFQVVVECTPLYQAVVLMRALALGVPGPGLLWHAAYLAAMGMAGLLVAAGRIRRLLLV